MLQVYEEDRIEEGTCRREFRNSGKEVEIVMFGEVICVLQPLEKIF